MRKYIFGFLLLAIFLPALLRAQTVEQDGAVDSYSLATARAEHIFIEDRGAIEAEQKCRDRAFSPSEALALNNKIAAAMRAASPTIALGAARLINLRAQAEDEMDSKISNEGCDGPAASKALRIFNSRLAGTSG